MGSGLGVVVRRAVESDIPFLLIELKKFSQFFNSKYPLYEDEAYVRMGLTGMMENHVLLCATLGETPIGFIGGIVTPHLFNPNIKVLAETFWWVEEGSRWTKAARLLLEELISYGKQNCHWITFGLEMVSPVNERCLTKRGFHLHEKIYLFEV